MLPYDLPASRSDQREKRLLRPGGPDGERLVLEVVLVEPAIVGEGLDRSCADQALRS